MLHRIFAITCITLLSHTACRSVKHAASDPGLRIIDGASLHQLNGTYSNQPVDDRLGLPYNNTMDYNSIQEVALLKQFYLLDEQALAEASRVEVNTLDKSRLKITAWNDEQMVWQFNVAGKIRKGFFRTKKYSRTKFPPLPPLYYFNDHVRLYITTDSTQHLVVKRSGARQGMIFFFGTGFRMDNVYRYPRAAP